MWFFPLNKQSPLIIKDCSSQIALVWFNLPLAVIIWVIPREENTESTPGCAAAGLILLQYTVVVILWWVCSLWVQYTEFLKCLEHVNPFNLRYLNNSPVTSPSALFQFLFIFLNLLLSGVWSVLNWPNQMVIDAFWWAEIQYCKPWETVRTGFAANICQWDGDFQPCLRWK